MPKSVSGESPPSITVSSSSAEPHQVKSGSASPAINFFEAQTYIDIEVQGRGGSYKQYSVTVNADTKHYRLPPTVSAVEGSDAELTVTLGEDAPAGGLAFDVTYNYGGNASATDTGTTPLTGDGRGGSPRRQR